MQLTLYHAIIQEKNAACQSFEKIIRQLFSKIGKISKYESETGCNERKYFQNHQNIYFLSEKKVEILLKVSYNRYVKLKY